MENIVLGADGRANQAISTLRIANTMGDLIHDVTIAPGLTLHIAPELEVSGKWRSEEAVVLDLDAVLSGQDGWVGLHLALPFESTLSYGMLGFAARTKARTMTEVRVCLRSGTESGFEDHFFEKPLLFSPQETTHLDVIELNSIVPVPQRAHWRELILFLPTQSFSLRLIDLRIFLV